MSIKHFLTSGAWRLWASIAIFRAIVFVVVQFLGLDWLRPAWLTEQVLYAEVWLLTLAGVDAGLWFIAVLVADTILVGYVIELVAEHFRRRRHKPPA